MNKLKYVFFGSPEFAAIILEKIILMGFPPSLVISNPDRARGRKKIVTPPPAKLVAQKYGIKVWQPEKLSEEEWEKEVGEVDFGIVAAYSKIIKDDVLKKMKLGVIGVHPSLLPFYRGATPIQSAILNGEKTTGVSLYIMDKEIDHGPILSQMEVSIEPMDTFRTLLPKLADTSAELIKQTIGAWLDDKIEPREQDHSRATMTKKFMREDGFVTPEDILSGKDPERINNMIRALSHEPGVWTYGQAFPKLNFPKNKIVKILKSEIEDEKLAIKEVQLEGKNPRII